MTDFSIKGHNLRNLQRKFNAKVFAIPEIQRSYVWKKDAVSKLMDSILKNYPVGIALVWDVPPVYQLLNTYRNTNQTKKLNYG